MHDYQTDDVAGDPASGINVYGDAADDVDDDDNTQITITLPDAYDWLVIATTDDNVRVSAKSSGVILDADVGTGGN